MLRSTQAHSNTDQALAFILTGCQDPAVQAPPPRSPQCRSIIHRGKNPMLHNNYSKGLGLIWLISSYGTPMPISTLSVGAKVGVTMDQQANMGELIHHFVSHCPEGEPCVLPMRGSSSSGGGEGQQATPPWWMRDHANNCHLQLLITSEEKAEVREMNAALSTTAQNSVVSVMVLSQ